MAPASALLVPAAATNAGAQDPDAAEHPLPQEGAVTKKRSLSQQQPQQKLECPRCSSSDTKFCYYNNYSAAQPRHYCRACRRYWTHGGTLRSVPVGGACRRGGKRRRASAEPLTRSSDSESPPLQPDLQDTRSLPVFPFLTDGAVFLPQFDLGLGGLPWTTPAAADHLYDGLALWSGCDGALSPTGVTGAWDDIGGLELTWPPAAGN